MFQNQKAIEPLKVMQDRNSSRWNADGKLSAITIKYDKWSRFCGKLSNLPSISSLQHIFIMEEYQRPTQFPLFQEVLFVVCNFFLPLLFIPIHLSVFSESCV